MLMSAVPAIIKGITCLGGEKGFGECAVEAATSLIGGGLFRAPAPGENVNVKNIAYVSCTGIRNDACNFQSIGLQVLERCQIIIVCDRLCVFSYVMQLKVLDIVDKNNLLFVGLHENSD